MRQEETIVDPIGIAASQGKSEPVHSNWFQKSLPRFLLLFCFLVPIKLSLSYILLFPVLLGVLAFNRRELLNFIKQNTRIAAAFLFFVLAAVISSVCGINPFVSLTAVLSLPLYALLIPAVAIQLTHQRNVRSPLPYEVQLVLALSIGQSVAALHSVLNSAFNDGLPKILIGQVTESGQLSLLIPFLIGVLTFLTDSEHGHQTRPLLMVSTVMTLLCLVTGFYTPFSYILVPLFIVALATAAFFIYQNRASTPGRVTLIRTIGWIVVPLLLGALLVNLKRGPWLGVALGVILVLFFTWRRLLVPLCLAVMACAVLITPVRSRVIASAQDFFINGGRSDIWQIGSELIQRYPLGIGYKNSPYLQRFNSQIPPELKHFHSNFLNILVETGWLGLLAYLGFLACALLLATRAFNSRNRRIYLGVFAAIFSWQIAGFVEYSFGDSEVLLLSYLLLGGMLGLQAIDPDGKRYSDDAKCRAS